MCTMAEGRDKRRSVKQRIRDTKRLLDKEDLPETVRLTKERVLRCLTTELEEKQQECRDRKLHKKYRMVKFFDKRKVMRKLKTHVKEWSTCTEEHKRCELQSSLEQLRKELNYIVHFPPSEKYLALYPSTDSTDTQATARKDEILLQVMDVVNDGELPDASASFLPPPLLKQLSCSTTAISSHTRPHLANKVLKTQLVSRIEAVKPERSFRKSRKPLYTAAVDEDPEISTTERSKEQLASDDFFLHNSAV